MPWWVIEGVKGIGWLVVFFVGMVAIGRTIKHGKR